VGNDAERILRLDTSSQRKDPGDLARGRIYTALLAHNWTPAQIATRTGKPLTTIQRILTLAGGNTDVHEMVKAGEVKPTIAAQAVKTHGDKAGAVLGAALVEAKAIGKTRVTNAVLKPKRIPEALVDQLAKAARAVIDYPGDATLLQCLGALLNEIDEVRG
jgi:ParB-like chromosome segregation protein Spo0J